MTAKCPDIGIRRIVAAAMTQPAMGGIENGVGGETGKRHGMRIDDRGGRVNRGGRGYVKLPLRVKSGQSPLGLEGPLPEVQRT